MLIFQDEILHESNARNPRISLILCLPLLPLRAEGLILCGTQSRVVILGDGG